MTQGRIHQDFYRNGPSHRDGADVTFQDIRKLFNFSSITIGKWVTADEQQIAANLFFDALYDLATILNVNEQVLSLNGTLSLAFGSGGQKGASAHYNSARRQLALAKNAGAGALKIYYYAMPQEMAARAFEACIQDHTIKNAFLVHGTKRSTEARLGIYPHGNLRIALNESLMLYFYQLGVAISHKQS